MDCILRKLEFMRGGGVGGIGIPDPSPSVQTNFTGAIPTSLMFAKFASAVHFFL